MAPQSARPPRWSDIEAPSQARLVLVPYGTSLAPNASLVSVPHSLFRERRVPALTTVAVLSATAGHIDAVGLLLLVGLFPAHVTGELVGLITAVGGGHHLTHPSRFAVLPVFVLALVLAAVVTRQKRKAGASPRSALLGLMTLSLAVCTASGFLSLFGSKLDPAWVLALREGSVVSAMAFQNAFTREAPASACPTTVMTGNLTHFVFELVEALAAKLRPSTTEETHARLVPRSRLRLVATALGAFVVGGVLGSYLAGLVGAFSFGVPMLAALGLWRRVAREG
jgi:uncharacterized membrane protein YoaK (UPF0700 family)